MNTLYQRICQIAAQLQQEGKTPSLALVRARAGSGIDPVKLFSAYQQWRNSPPSHVETQNTTEASPAAEVIETNDIAVLRADIARLEAKLDQILTLLQPRSTDVER